MQNQGRYCNNCRNIPNDLSSPDELCWSCREGRSMMSGCLLGIALLLAVATWYLQSEFHDYGRLLIMNPVFIFAMILAACGGLLGFINNRF